MWPLAATSRPIPRAQSYAFEGSRPCFSLFRHHAQSYSAVSLLAPVSAHPLYSFVVRSILENGAVIWHPYVARNGLSTVRIQNKFLCYAAFELRTKHPIQDYSLISTTLRISALASQILISSLRSLRTLSNLTVCSLLSHSVFLPTLLETIPFLDYRTIVILMDSITNSTECYVVSVQLSHIPRQSMFYSITFCSRYILIVNIYIYSQINLFTVFELMPVKQIK